MTAPVCAQQSSAMMKQDSVVTVADYQRAEKFLGRNSRALVQDELQTVMWTTNGKLLFGKQTGKGMRFLIANPADGTQKPLFDRKKLAQSIGQLINQKIDASRLSLHPTSYSASKNRFVYKMRSGRFETNLNTYQTKKLSPKAKPKEILSPDGKKAAYIKKYNLWVRDTKTGKRTQLTTDGKKNYGYATNNAGWIKNDRPVLKWGPHSQQIATFRQDARGVGEMYLYNTKVGHSNLKRWKYAFPGDSTIFRIERVVVHLGDDGRSPRVVHLNMKPDAQRSTITDHVAGPGGKLLDTQWSGDGTKLAFVSVSQNHKINTLRIANAKTGDVRNVLTEKADTYYESGFSTVSWRILFDSDGVLWYSERDNWAHFYLYDLKNGRLKHQITRGNWRVLDLQHVDEQNRTIYFTGSNRESGNPYYQYLYRVNFDGSGLKNLTPASGTHHTAWSENRKYFVDTYSTPTSPPVAVVRNREGDETMKLARADITPLKKMGWKAPTQFTVKARDGKSDLYGMMFTPTHFDSSKSYPVIDYVYPGPQTGSISTRSFRAFRRDHQALAELGFIVVEVDGMGTPGRSKSFHDKWYGNMGDNTIPDQVTMIKQLAKRHSWIDTAHVGIWGHSGGGNASTRAILAYPNFFKVAISESGNHDTRNYESDWGDKWQGLLKKKNNVDPNTLKRFEKGDNYDSQANELLAQNLKGHLLLMHGLMDTNVPPTTTLLVADALIRAGKDFDMFMIPNAGHGYGYAYYYIMNKRWDYFVKHLMGAEPPTGFHFGHGK